MSTSEQDVPRPRVATDLASGVILLAVVWVFLANSGDGRLDWAFPVTLSYVIGLLGLYLVIRGLLGFGERMTLLPPLVRGEGVDVAFFVPLAVVYVILIEPVGFWPTTAVMIVVACVYLDTTRSRRNLLIAVGVAAGSWAGGDYLFSDVFFVPLPEAGWLPF